MKLIKNSRGRYEIPREGFNKELSCGASAELKLGNTWVKGEVEHDGIDYYFYTEGSGKIYLNESLELR